MLESMLDACVLFLALGCIIIDVSMLCVKVFFGRLVVFGSVTDRLLH